jgi:DHA2 family multidrug resistance protein-like MFS transporter
MSETSVKAGRKEWIALAVLALPCLVYAMDLTVLNVALPSLSADLKPSSTQLLWIVDIYGFLAAGTLIIMGTLGDRIGRRRVLLLGGAAFAIASILAACSRNAAMLIAARALLGIAGATLAPSTLSLIRNMFLDAKQRTVAIGVWTTSFSVGAVIGPLLGGAVLQHFGWSAVFLLALPVMLCLLILGPLLLPEYRTATATRLDVTSALLSLAAVLTAIYGMKGIARGGLAWAPAAFVLVGLSLGVIFVRRQRTLEDPLIDLELFRVPAFGLSLGTFTLTTLVVFGFYVFTAQYLQLVLGLSPLSAGLWMLFGSCSVVLGSMLAPSIVRRVHPAYVMGAGIGLTALGFAVYTQLASFRLGAVAVGSTLVYLGMGPVYTLGTDLIIGSAPPARAGAAAALSETSAELGGALGIAIIGSIGSVAYRASMAHALLSRVPSAARQAAQETIGGALAAAAQLPAAAQAQLLAAARAAFVHSMEQCAAVCGLIAAGTAIASMLVLRRVGVASDQPSAAHEEDARASCTGDDGVKLSQHAGLARSASTLAYSASAE